MTTATDPTDALTALAQQIVGGQSVSAGSVASSLIQGVTIESQLTPPIGPFNPFALGGGSSPATPAAPSAGGSGVSVSGLAGIALGYIRPTITIDTAAGEIVLAPWGQANGNWLPNAAGLIAGIAAGTAWMLGQEAAAKKLGYIALGGFAFGYLTRPQP